MTHDPVAPSLLEPLFSAAAELGMPFDRALALSRGALRGKRSSRNVTLGFRFDAGRPRAFAVSISTRHTSPPSVAFRPLDGDARWLSGDPRFDAVIRAIGPIHHVRAILDAPMRGVLLALFHLDAHESISVRRGKISLWMHAGFAQGPAMIARVVEAIVEVAEILERGPEDVVRRLAANVLSDPDAGVRRNNAEALLRMLPWAQTSQAEKDRILSAMVEMPELRPAIRTAALQRLAFAPSAALAPLMERLLLDRELCWRAVDYFEQVSYPRAIEGFVALIPAARGERDAQRIARALGRSGDAAAEPGLLRLLEHQSVAVRVAVVQALCDVGTIDAVPKLRAAARGFFVDRQLKVTAQAAVEAIQGRAKAEPGRLSLLRAHERGRLSFAESSEGALSIAEDTGGELSSPDDADEV